MQKVQKESQSEETTEPKLTPRELEVLVLAVEGHSNQAIAEMLDCAKRTIDFHLANIYEKLAVSSRMQAVNAARKQGLLSV